MPASDDLNENFEPQFPNGKCYNSEGDRKYFYENGEKILCEYNAEEDGWFEVL